MLTPDDLTTPEVWRDLQEYMQRTDRDREELRSEVREGFREVRDLINALSFVAPDVYTADQRRQDDALETVKQMQAEQRGELGAVKKLALTALGSFFITVVGALAAGAVA